MQGFFFPVDFLPGLYGDSPRTEKTHGLYSNHNANSNTTIGTAIGNASFNATSTSADNHDSSTTTLLTNRESITLNAVNFIAFRGETIVGNQSENDIVYYLSERSQSTWNGNNHVNVTGQRLSALYRTTKLTVTILVAWHYQN